MLAHSQKKIQTRACNGLKTTSQLLIGSAWWVIVLIAAVQAAPTVYAQSTVKPPSNTTKVLIFPDSFSSGSIYQQQIDQRGQTQMVSMVARAQGKVTVPSNIPLILKVSYALAEHVDTLRKLPPDAVDSIGFYQIDTEKEIDLGALSGLTGLRRIILHHCPVTDAQASKLAVLKNVWSLELWACGIDGTCFHDFEKLHKLTVLRVGSNRLKPEAFVALGHMPQIRLLNLHSCQVNDAALAQISKIRDLWNLDIANSPEVTAKGLKLLNNCKKLQALRVSRGKLSAEDILVVKGLPLNELTVSSAAMTPKDLAALHAAFPKAHLIIEDH